MRPIRFPIAALVLALPACGPSVDAPPNQADLDALAEEVREVMEEFTAATNSHDPERLFDLYKDTEEFVYMGCTDPLFGFDSFSARVGPYYRSNTDVTFEQEILQVQVLNPGAAVVTLRGSSTEASALFWTLVLVRQDDDRWLIAHEHESWPGCPEPAPPHPTGEMPAVGVEG